MNYEIGEVKERIESLQDALDSLDNLYEDFTDEEEKAISDAYVIIENRKFEYERKKEEMIYGEEEY